MDFEGAWQQADKIGGWLSEPQARVLWDAVVAQPAPPTVVEIGSYLGKSATVLGHAAALKGGHVWCVDVFDSATIQMYVDGMAKHGSIFINFVDTIYRADLMHVVTPLWGTSAEISNYWDGRPVDVLYIDGDHSLEAVQQDTMLWTPFLAPGGTLILDDASEPGPGSMARQLEAAGWATMPAAPRFWAGMKPHDHQVP